jgi:hypothetical protein
MLRALTCAFTVVLLFAVTVLAKQYDGTITKIDTDKNIITVKIGDDTKTFVYTDSTEFLSSKDKAISKERLGKLAEKLGDKGRPAILNTSEKDDKEEVKDGNPVLAKVKFKPKN